MILNYVSANSVIAKIVRDTGVEQSDILPDILEWLAEAMDHMQIQLELYPTHKDLTLNFHAAKIPKGCARLLAVSFCGFRLRYRNRDNDPRAKVRVINGVDSARNPNSVFETDPMAVEVNPVQDKARRWPYPYAVNQMPWHEEAWYQVKGGHIWTSFPKGQVTLHYETAPLDDNEIPLVPDNMSFKEAVYYHVRGKMVAAGKYKDPVYTMRDILGLYDQYASKAIEEITYPSPDQMESMIDTWVRLIPSNEYFKNFSDPVGPEPFYDTFGEMRSQWHEI